MASACYCCPASDGHLQCCVAAPAHLPTVLGLEAVVAHISALNVCRQRVPLTQPPCCCNTRRGQLALCSICTGVHTATMSVQPNITTVKGSEVEYKLPGFRLIHRGDEGNTWRLSSPAVDVRQLAVEVAHVQQAPQVAPLPGGQPAAAIPR